MTIYLDFDGTVVEHEFPQIGRNNFGCMEVILKLQEAGHRIILNTYRADSADGTLEKALNYLNEDSFMFFKDRETEIQQITEHTSNKLYPAAWNWNDMLESKIIFIDDITPGIPLKKCCMVQGNMVDWKELDLQFIEHKVYEK